MALFRFGGPEPAPVIRGEGVLLRVPRIEDFEEWAQLRAVSRAHLVPWEPAWPEDDLTRAAFRRRIRRYEADIRADLAHPFLIVREADGVLLGGLTLGLIRRGVAQTCSLGYWIGAPHAGQGWMSRAVPVALNFAFEGLGLRRVEAASMPENLASQRVLEKAGFRREGFAREYLCIAGRWRDHVLFAILAREFAARGQRPPAALPAGDSAHREGGFGLPLGARADTKD